MKWTLASLLVVGLTVAVGCSSANPGDKQAASLTPAVTDITPAPVAAQQPVVYEPSAAPAGAQQQAGAGGKYTVKKGDTLWKIAAAQYGNGNQWQRITSANAGLSAETLKAGQTIVLP